MGNVMDQIMDVIKKRISIRAYKDQALSKETVNAILEAAKYAPTARNLQQLEYKVVIGKDRIKKLSDVITNALKQENSSMPVRPTFYYNAPLLIIITGPRDNAFIDADAGLAAQNIMLYAASLNLGSCFIGMTKFIEKDKATLKELHISNERKIVAAVVCGYPDENPTPKEKKMNVEFFQ
jgi:nitroreductase